MSFSGPSLTTHIKNSFHSNNPSHEHLGLKEDVCQNVKHASSSAITASYFSYRHTIQLHLDVSHDCSEQW